MLASRSAKSGGMTSVASARPLSSSRAASSGRAADELHLGRVGEPLAEVEALVADVDDARQRAPRRRATPPAARPRSARARPRRARSAAGRRRVRPRAAASAPARARPSRAAARSRSARPRTSSEDDAAVLEREHAVGLERLVEEVRRDDGPGAGVARAADALPQRPRRAGGSSEAVGSSSSSSSRRAEERDREVEPLLVADREVRRRPVVGRQLELGEQRRRPPRPGSSRLEQPGEQRQVLARREAPVLRRPLRRPADRGRRQRRSRPRRPWRAARRRAARAASTCRRRSGRAGRRSRRRGRRGRSARARRVTRSAASPRAP